MPPVSWEETIHQCVRVSVTVSYSDSRNNKQSNNPRKPCVCVVLTAIAMAMLASETVSMGEEMRGVFMVICLVSAEVRSWTKDIRGIFGTHGHFSTLRKLLSNILPI